MFILWCSCNVPALRQLDSLSPSDGNIQTFAAHFVYVNNPHLSLLITLSLQFSLPNIFFCNAPPPPPIFLLCNITPPPPLSTSSASLRASAVQISVYTSGCRLTTPQSSTPHSGEPSDADLLCMAATLEPRHIWSGVRLLKTGATLGPNKCSPAKPMRGSLLIHGPRFHPQSRSLKLLQRPRKDWIL